MPYPITKVHSKYGAPMGRCAQGHGADPTTTFELRRIRINNGGYDDGGAYWGIGQPLYWYCAYEVGKVENGPCEFCEASVATARHTDCQWTKDGKHVHPMRDEEVEISAFIRADDREHAKEIVRARYPTARFKRQ